MASNADETTTIMANAYGHAYTVTVTDDGPDDQLTCNTPGVQTFYVTNILDTSRALADAIADQDN